MGTSVLELDMGKRFPDIRRVRNFAYIEGTEEQIIALEKRLKMSRRK